MRVADAELGESASLPLDINLRSRVASGLDDDQMRGGPGGNKLLHLRLDLRVDFSSDASSVDKLGTVGKSHEGE